MAQKGLIILNAYRVIDSAFHMAKRLQDEFNALGISVDIKQNNEALACIDGENASLKMYGYSFVIFLDKDLYVSRLIEKSGIPMFNSSKAIETCDDKMYTYVALSNNGIRMPKTVPAPLYYGGSDNGEFLNRLILELPFPMVCKKNYGSLGEGVFLIHNKEELIDVDAKLRSEYQPRLYQEYIDSSFGFDYRLIVIGGHFVAGMKRCSNGNDFRSNIGLGGSGEVVELDPRFIDMAEKAAKVIGLDYCGVDIMEGKNGEPILCEVNSNAFIEGIEKVTGANVAKAYAEYIKANI